MTVKGCLSTKASIISEKSSGDIVIINGDTSKVHYVKRLIGKPGETVEMKNDTLYINGKNRRTVPREQ